MKVFGESCEQSQGVCGAMSVLQTDKTQTDYWYYGGSDSDGTYVINRYDSSGLRGFAIGNWIDRYSLTYN